MAGEIRLKVTDRKKCKKEQVKVKGTSTLGLCFWWIRIDKDEDVSCALCHCKLIQRRLKGKENQKEDGEKRGEEEEEVSPHWTVHCTTLRAMLLMMGKKQKEKGEGRRRDGRLGDEQKSHMKLHHAWMHTWTHTRKPCSPAHNHWYYTLSPEY